MSMEYEDVQKQLNQALDTGDDDPEPNEDVLDQDDMFSMDDVEPGEDEDVADDDAPEPPAKPDAGKPKAAAVTGTEQAEADSIREQAIKLVGGDAVIKVKGVERKLSDLSSAELVNALQKGIRGDQLFAEVAQTRREVQEERALVERGARLVQDYLDRIGQGQPQQPHQQAPNFLRVSPDDSEEVAYFKRSQMQLMQEVDRLSKQVAGKTVQEGEQALVNEVKTLANDYPLASIDEVLAIKVARPTVNTEEVMQASHNYYSSDVFIEKGLSANPTLAKKIAEKAVNDYLAKKGSAKKVPGIRSGGGGTDKADRQRPIRTFDDADTKAKDYIRELMRSASS